MNLDDVQGRLDRHKELMAHLRELEAEKMRTIQLASLIRASLVTWAARAVDSKETAVIALRNEIRQIMIAYEVAGS